MPVTGPGLPAGFLEACGRDDIPVGIGVSRADGSPETMHEYADSYRLEQYSGGIWEDGVGRALELIAAEPELTVIGIAPADHSRRVLPPG